jgi:hypothetical protein
MMTTIFVIAVWANLASAAWFIWESYKARKAKADAQAICDLLMHIEVVHFAPPDLTLRRTPRAGVERTH